MIYYCTLFDSFYLSRGIAMYESLYAHSADFHLFIFAFDDLSYSILKDLNLDKVTVISLNEFETPDLLEIKSSRTKGEYCWTCSSSTIMYTLDTYKVENCTYIDADLVFYSDPFILINELVEAKKTVLITEHRYSKYAGIYSIRKSGRFCVQFMTFFNTEDSLKVLKKWRSQCIEWCFARYEDGKFGDQKYLDDWPLTYTNVHILKNEGGGIAPWNVLKYRFLNKNGIITARLRKEKTLFPVIFFHFQYVKFLVDGGVDLGWYIIPGSVYRLFYIPYLVKIRGIEKRLKDNYPGFDPGILNKYYSLKNYIFKRIFGYNIKNINK